MGCNCSHNISLNVGFNTLLSGESGIDAHVSSHVALNVKPPVKCGAFMEWSSLSEACVLLTRKAKIVLN